MLRINMIQLVLTCSLIIFGNLSLADCSDCVSQDLGDKVIGQARAILLRIGPSANKQMKGADLHMLLWNFQAFC